MQEDGRIILRAGGLVAELAPQHGGRLARLTLHHSGLERELVPPLRAWKAAARSWPKEGAYPLFPYSNRIEGAAFPLGDRLIRLREHPASPGYALHGPAHLRVWQGRTLSETRAVLSLDYQADEDWPFGFHAEQEFTLDSEGLTVRMSIRNDTDLSVPLGLGWHPYLTCEEDSVVTHDAKRLWEMNASASATGRSERLLGACGDDACLSEWSHAELRHKDGSGFAMTADPLFDHLILHRPSGMGYVCIEPVSHVADAVHLAARGIEGTGLRMGAPGETLAGRVRLSLLL